MPVPLKLVKKKKENQQQQQQKPPLCKPVLFKLIINFQFWYDFISFHLDTTLNIIEHFATCFPPLL